MRIAITGNVFPIGAGKFYGGERIIYYLIRGLKALGHELVLFGTQGCTVEPELLEAYVPVPPLDSVSHDVYYEAAVEYETKTGRSFDVYACHYFGERWNPECTNRWPYVELVWNSWSHIKHQLGIPNFNTVCYSYTLQRVMQRHSLQASVIHYGIPMEDYPVGLKPKDYVVWIGKIEGGKGVDWAIETAKRAGRRIVIMGPPYNPGYFRQAVLPHIDQDRVIWVRGVDDRTKARIFRDAYCFLSTNVDGWHEMLGIVNLESLASGCPIVAWTKEGAEESAVLGDGIVKDGVNGFLLRYQSSSGQWAEKADEAAALLNGPIKKISREDCRKSVEIEYSHHTMARRWNALYEMVQGKRRYSVVEIP